MSTADHRASVDTAITFAEDPNAANDDEAPPPDVIHPEDEELESEYMLNPARTYQNDIKGMNWLHRTFYNFFEAQTTWIGVLFGWLVGLAVIVSVLVVLLESIPSLRPIFVQRRVIRRSVDLAVMVIFTIDLVGRFYAAPRRLKFFKNFMNWIDIITLIPFIIEAISSYWTGGYIRFLRLLRVLRLLHGLNPSHGSIGMLITTRAIKHSLSQIFAVVAFLMIMVVLCSSFMYLAEQEVLDEKTGLWLRNEGGELKPSPFQSIPHAFYWAITTLTTTGYGDTYPVTAWGKVIAGITMLFGVLAIALPTSILGSNFVAEWTTYNRIKFQQRVRDQAKGRQHAGDVGMKLFNEKKGEQIRVLRLDNERMLTVISEIQDQLAMVNPPHYFHKYKVLQNEHEAVTRQMETMKHELEDLRRRLSHYEKQ